MAEKNDYEYFKYQLKINKSRYSAICDLLEYEKKTNGLAFYIRSLIAEDMKKRVLNNHPPFKNMILQEGKITTIQKEREEKTVVIEGSSEEEIKALEMKLFELKRKKKIRDDEPTYVLHDKDNEQIVSTSNKLIEPNKKPEDQKPKTQEQQKVESPTEEKTLNTNGLINFD